MAGKASQRRDRLWLYVLIFLVGAAVFSYPLVADAVNRRSQSLVINAYELELQKASAAEIAEARDLARAYNALLIESGHDLLGTLEEAQKPVVEGAYYADVLNVGAAIGHLEVPVLEIDYPIYHGTSDEVLQHGIGHIELSTLPIGGPSTHAVLTGHRGLPSARLLRDLDKVVVGDVFLIHILDEVLAYEIDQIKIIVPTDISDLEIVPGMDYVTLVTCDPYMINTNRLIVRGHRVAYHPEESDVPLNQPDQSALPAPSREIELEPTNRITFWQKFREYFIAVGVGGLLLVLGWLFYRRRRGRIEART
ncbi:MAG: class C sortase [Chloroflexi bacterium]|nr:class C sortase [Chloroflexota bacterium]